MFKWLFGSKDDAPAVSGTRELLVITRHVGVPPERAFAVFADEIDRWWPRDLTWGKDKVAKIAIDPKMGGLCTEKTTDGATAVFGSVLTISRPGHIVLAWQIRPDRQPEPDERTASRVDVRFSPAESGGTDVVLVHRDFPRHGDGWEQYKAEMAGKNGWPRLIALYAAAASA